MTREELVALMNELDSQGGADEIAAFLMAARVRARRHSSCDCAVARFIKSRGGGPQARVAGAHAALAPFDETPWVVDVPKRVQEFMSAFDDGTYPDLLEPEPKPPTDPPNDPPHDPPLFASTAG